MCSLCMYACTYIYMHFEHMNTHTHTHTHTGCSKPTEHPILLCCPSWSAQPGHACDQVKTGLHSLHYVCKQVAFSHAMYRTPSKYHNHKLTSSLFLTTQSFTSNHRNSCAFVCHLHKLNSDSTILRVHSTLLQDLFDRLVLVDSAPKRSALLNYQEAHLFGLR